MSLKDLIKKKQAIVGIIGLGYVGLPLAILIKKQGFKVFGFDKDKKKINNIKNGISPILDINKKSIKVLKKNDLYSLKEINKINQCDLIIICLPTPLTKNNNPDMSYLKTCLKQISKHLKKNQALILESTVYPGATNEIFSKTLIEKFSLGKNFFLGYSPERVNPAGEGKIKYVDITKVVSGYTKECLNLTSLFYKKIFKTIYKTKDIATAEFSKLYENSYRAVNISLTNEMKMVCDKFNLNIYDVINASRTKPFGFTSFLPGPGMGGHCIPIDPLFISWAAKKKGITANFIENSRKINQRITNWIIQKVEKTLKNKKNKLLILGVAYKKNINDCRESPAIKILNHFFKKYKNIKFHDPYISSILVNNKKLQSIKKFNYNNLKYYDATIICTDHDFYDFKKIIKNSKLVFDTRGVMRKTNFKNEKYIVC
jgi:UDP-N-acetyl-D-glucosamine dehydrogenase